MTEHQEFEKIVREISARVGSEPAEDEKVLVKEVWDAAVAYGRRVPAEQSLNCDECQIAFAEGKAPRCKKHPPVKSKPSEIK